MEDEKRGLSRRAPQRRNPPRDTRDAQRRREEVTSEERRNAVDAMRQKSGRDPDHETERLKKKPPVKKR